MPMKQELVGKVTEEEKLEIMRLHERILGLNELMPTVQSMKTSNDENESMYNKVVMDLGKSKRLLQQWWDTKSVLYKWKSIPDGSWTINFETNEIYLVG